MFKAHLFSWGHFGNKGNVAVDRRQGVGRSQQVRLPYSVLISWVVLASPLTLRISSIVQGTQKWYIAEATGSPRRESSRVGRTQVLKSDGPAGCISIPVGNRWHPQTSWPLAGDCKTLKLHFCKSENWSNKRWSSFLTPYREFSTEGRQKQGSVPF